MFLGLLKYDSEQLFESLQLIRDSNELWTTCGIASLSKSDVFFGKGENYWYTYIKFDTLGADPYG